MAHPSRAAAAQRTLEQLQGLDAAIAYDPDPAGAPSAWRTFQRIVAVAPRDGHLLVVQEDVVVGRGFARAVGKVAAAAPGAIVALYAGKLLRAVPHLRAAAARCQTMAPLGYNEYIPCVSVLIPGGLLDDLDGWGRRNIPAGYRHDDEALGGFARGRGLPVFTTIPSLVDHDNSVDSIAGHSEHGVRNAWCLAPADFDLGSIDFQVP